MKFALHGGLVTTAWPPGGWRYVENATGWHNPDPMDSFGSATQRIIQHRRSNTGYGLSTEAGDVESDLMTFTALRLLSDHPDAADKWVVALDEEAKKKSPVAFQKTRQTVPLPLPAVPAGNRVERLLSRVRSIARGVLTLSEWVGAGHVPVPPSQANRRAMVCVGCPLNVEGNAFESAMAEAVRAQTIVKNSLSLMSEYEDRLKTCSACGCYLRLKVWVPLETIREHQTAEVEAKLHPSCWIRNESQATRATGTRAPQKTRTITLKRDAAFGDVIASTIVASKLHEIGIGTRLVTAPVIGEALRGHPHIDEILAASPGKIDVGLDRAYEDSPERVRKDIPLLLLEAADRQLQAIGIKLPDLVNRVPTLPLTDDERWSTLEAMQRLPHPWIVVVDGSGSWPNRTWAMAEIAKLPKLLDGTLIWSKPFGWLRPPGGFSPYQIRTFRELMATIAHADLVITPDTGPIHVAAAFQRKIIALEQCNDTHLRLTELTDWSAVGAPLNCLRCGEFTCPIDKERPPCQLIPAELVASATRVKLATSDNGKVSAVVAAIRWRGDTSRCLAAAVNQCDEVVLVGDGEFKASSAIKGVRLVPTTGTRLGYGRTAMRAIRGTIGEFILLLNDDCFLDPGAVDRMKEAMTPGVGMVGALLRYPDGTIQHGGTFRPRGAVGFGHIDHRARRSRFSSITEMEAVTGACVLVRREALYEVRGFDERYDCYSEDTDFCMKLRRAGWRIMFQPAATAIHVEHQSTGPTKEAMLSHGNEVFSRLWRTHILATTPLISEG